MSSPDKKADVEESPRAQKRPADSGDDQKEGSRWGEAQISGGDERKQKFMRLMGGNKEKKPEKDTADTTNDQSGPAAEADKPPLSTFVPENVHSANDWEHAQLQGGDNRKQKFMRLMGASKAQTDSQAKRRREDVDSMNSKLERQYNQGMELKLSGAPRRHVGLGFQSEEPTRPDSSSSRVPGPPTDSGNGSSGPSAASATDSNEADAKPSSSDSASGQSKNSLNFVKSS